MYSIAGLAKIGVVGSPRSLKKSCRFLHLKRVEDFHNRYHSNSAFSPVRSKCISSFDSRIYVSVTNAVQKSSHPSNTISGTLADALDSNSAKIILPKAEEYSKHCFEGYIIKDLAKSCLGNRCHNLIIKIPYAFS